MRFELGDFEVIALRDADGSFATFREAFGLDSDEPWPTLFHAYAIRISGRTIVVDTGVGPPPGEFLPERQGRLPELLAEHGVSPAEVELVVLTHLHVDHVGWNHLFEQARIVAARADYDWFLENRGESEYFVHSVRSLADAGRLELVEGLTDLGDGVVAEPIPGHTPGHMGVSVHSGDGHLRLLGDLALDELQLADPGLPFSGEVDPEAAAQARRSVLRTAVANDAVVGLSHLPGGLGRIRIADGGFAWEALG